MSKKKNYNKHKKSKNRIAHTGIIHSQALYVNKAPTGQHKNSCEYYKRNN